MILENALPYSYSDMMIVRVTKGTVHYTVVLPLLPLSVFLVCFCDSKSCLNARFKTSNTLPLYVFWDLYGDIKNCLAARAVTSDTCDTLPLCVFWVCCGDSKSCLGAWFTTSDTCNT